MLGSSQPLRRILVPTDGSAPSANAVALAVSLASQHGSEVLFCYAFDLGTAVAQTTTPYAATDPTPMIDAMSEEAKAILDDASRQAAAANVPSTCAKLEGRPITEILRYAAKQRVGAIVMGTRGKRGIARFFLGSTAEGVLRATDVPVFVVHGGRPAKPFRFGRIMAAVDDSDPAEAAADYAIGFALNERADLVLCNVVETPKFLQNLNFLRQVGARAESAGVRHVEQTIASGEPVEEILSAAAECHADLIAIGTHGRRGWGRMLLGSVAEGVVRHSPIPVVVVRFRSSKVRTSERTAERVLAHV